MEPSHSVRAWVVIFFDEHLIYFSRFEFSRFWASTVQSEVYGCCAWFQEFDMMFRNVDASEGTVSHIPELGEHVNGSRHF